MTIKIIDTESGREVPSSMYKGHVFGKVLNSAACEAANGDMFMTSLLNEAFTIVLINSNPNKPEDPEQREQRLTDMIDEARTAASKTYAQWREANKVEAKPDNSTTEQ
tara:strand:- start:1909 stop:2232 length:324 start_codon:yes stop_codon:yes gene_type:complete